MRLSIILIIFVGFICLACNPAKNASFGSLGRTPVVTTPTLTINSSSFINSNNQAAFTFSGTCSGNGLSVDLTGMLTESPLCAFGVWTLTKDLSALTESTHTLFVNHQHTDGQKAPTLIQNIIKDTVAPSLAFIAPTAGTIINNNNKTNFNLSGTCSDIGQVITIFSTPTGISTTSTCIAGSWNKTINATAVPDGALHIYALSSDVAGNTNLQDSGSLTKITALPTLAINFPTNGSYVNNSQKTNFIISGTCSENGQNVTLVSSPAGISTSIICTSNAWNTTLDLTALSEGNITFTANHSSSAGNASSPSTLSIIKDTASPTVLGLSNDLTPTASKTWSWTCNETCTYRYLIDLNPTTSPTGDYSSLNSASISDSGGTVYIHVQAKDAAGNESAITDASGLLTYTRVKVSVSGKLYEALGLTLQNTITGESLTIEDNGNFQFSPWNGEASYNVIISAQPSNHVCSINSNTGVLPSAGIINVNITCTPNTFTLGGNITGLTAGNTLTLMANSNTGGASNTLTLSNSETSYTMPESRYAGRMYYMKIISSSATVTCRFDNTNKTEAVLTSNLTDINITCTPRIPGDCSNQSAELATTNGIVKAILCDGNDNLFVGGYFTDAGVFKGNHDIFSTGTDLVTNPKRLFFKVNGTINSSVADGFGGWFIGGQFTQVGKASRTNLAHILSDGSLDPSWSANVTSSSGARVSKLLRNSSDLYIAGYFDYMNGITRHGLGKVSTKGTGSLDSVWNPDVSGLVYDIALHQSSLYVGGSFATIKSTNRTNIAKITATGTVVVDNWSPQANSYVYVLASDNTHLYVGGSFDTIASSSRGHLARFYLSNGALDIEWDAPTDGSVSALAIINNTIYIGGSFYNVQSQPHQGIAKLSATATGAAILDSWDAQLNTNQINSITKSDSENAIYIGGSFTSAKGSPRSKLAKFSISDGSLSPWNPRSGSNAVAISTANGELFTSGSFYDADVSSLRTSIAQISTTTGRPTSWAVTFNTSGQVYAMTKVGGYLYLGGTFYTINGVSAKALAKIQISDASLINNSSLTAFATSHHIDAMLLNGTDLYIGGYFTKIGSVTKYNLAKIDTNTDTADVTWNPIENSGPNVYSLAISGTSLYVGGSFTSITNGGTSYSRASLAKFSLLGTGSIDTTWDANLTFSAGSVYSYSLLTGGGYLYIGGSYGKVGSTVRYGLSRINETDASLDTNWTTGINSSGSVKSIISDGSYIYATGSFSYANSIARSGIAKIAMDSSGSLDNTWKPALSTFSQTVGTGSSLYLSGANLFLGGTFDTANTIVHPNLAPLSLTGTGTIPGDQ